MGKFYMTPENPPESPRESGLLSSHFRGEGAPGPRAERALLRHRPAETRLGVRPKQPGCQGLPLGSLGAGVRAFRPRGSCGHGPGRPEPALARPPHTGRRSWKGRDRPCPSGSRAQEAADPGSRRRWQRGPALARRQGVCGRPHEGTGREGQAQLSGGPDITPQRAWRRGGPGWAGPWAAEEAGRGRGSDSQNEVTQTAPEGKCEAARPETSG